jgi:hypothetical protein
MPSKAAVIAYHYHILSGHPAHFDQVESRICAAHRKGFSVVEITRIIGSRKADYPHAVLVKRGEIMPGKRGRPAKGSVPDSIAIYLRKRSLSFAKWCAGWGFDLTEAATAIRSVSDGVVLDALRRDFPGCYRKIKGLDKHAPYVRPPNCPSPKLEATVIWDDRAGCYRAEHLENRQVRGYGLSMEEAVKNLKVSHNFRLMLVRLAAGCEV